ncbi:MAG TPA: tRNA (guanosine(46)-N7)-methyltransferase TrmB [Bacteroidales bacterium]|nr:tRNA (guanosine(46)-N7)-methyltransferase TrmB [Bacteroidales bacterium]
MSKNKLARFAEMETFEHVFQPGIQEVFHDDFHLKGKWSEWFENNNPIVLELGCGKGEYTVGLARKYPDINFIGVDIKGARMWLGAKQSRNEALKNVAFLRTRIELISSFFGEDEVSAIWITFPDPQLKKNRRKKRLTAPGFLSYYARFIKSDGLIHLKTDSRALYEFTKRVISHNQLPVVGDTDDLYHSRLQDVAAGIKTFYEQMFLNEGIPIKLLIFKLGNKQSFTWHPDDEK